jgi:nucleoside-diphosphate-sugar epimerase
MNIAVTGATGFIGTHLITCLVQRGYKPIAAGRNKEKLAYLSKSFKIPTYCCDLRTKGIDWFKVLGKPETVIHLAWGSLNDYNSLSHVEDELPAHYSLIKELTESGGTKRIIIAGTCFEYGLQEGKLAEDRPPMPILAYAVAKDSLRRFLELLSLQNNFSLVWLRYFYMFGPGQNPKSFPAQLDSAIASHEPIFNMSEGQQLRDYLPVEEVAERTAWLSTKTSATGIFNICSGKPISLLEMAQRKIRQSQSPIKLNLGYYPYPKYEPMAFWGNNLKLKHLIEHETKR